MKLRFATGGLAVALLSAAVGTRASGTGSLETSRVKIVSNPNRDAYALVRGDQWMSANQSIEELNRIHDRFGGDFLWLRRHGETRVVRDRAKLEEARSLFGALRVLEPEQRALEGRQRDLDHRQEALEHERDRIEDSFDGDEDGPAPAAEHRMKELDGEIKALETESRALDETERALDRRSDELEKDAEAKLWGLIDRWIADGTAQRP